MSAYGQQAAKRQKVRENRDTEYFQGIDKIEYNNSAGPSDVTCYRYYSGAERAHSRPIDDWVRFSVSLTHFRSYGSNPSHHPRPWDDGTNTLENHKRCIKAFFEFITKLGLKYWTAFDTDLVPWSDSWDEMRSNWDDMVEYLVEMMQRYHVKLMWMAPDLHSHYRYSSGALTPSDATTYTQAATQIKKCLELSQRLNAECFQIWPTREGYDNIFKTDVAKEIKLFVKLLKLTADYKEKLNFRCQLLIMPYYKFGKDSYKYDWDESLVNMYMWDVTSCLYLLKQYNLERYYKVCSPPGHHMYMANIYNMLGGVIITNDLDHYNTKKLTLMMKSIIDQGSPPPGGVSLQLRCPAPAPRDIVTSHVTYIDAIAKGLKHAAGVISEQLFSKYLQQRYSTFHSGFGSRLVTMDISMEECEEYYKKNHSTHTENSSKAEHLELTFQRYLDSTDHI